MARQPQSWRGFREFDRFRENLDDLFDRFLGRPAEVSTPGTRGPAIESFIEDDKLVVRADLPGIDPAQVEVTVDGSLLTIRGTREQRREENQCDYIHREVVYGSFERSLTLPHPVKTEAINATYHNGVLEVTMPRSAETTPRKIAIQIERRRAPAGPSRSKSRP